MPTRVNQMVGRWVIFQSVATILAMSPRLPPCLSQRDGSSENVASTSTMSRHSSGHTDGKHCRRRARFNELPALANDGIKHQRVVEHVRFEHCGTPSSRKRKPANTTARTPD